jgi:multidrug resistance efflux pump
MKSIPSLGLRLTVTLLAVAVAGILVAYQLRIYILNPWTRDGLVEAYVVQIAARVNGPVVDLPILDNQMVKKGDLLFRIDPRTFEANAAQAKANLKEAQAKYDDAKDKADRAQRIHRANPGAESQELLVQLLDAEKLAAAAVEGAQAHLDSANLDLDFTQIVAPVDGYITHLTLDLGTQAVANIPVLALVNKNSFWVSAFFRETQLNHIQPGDKAVVRLMAYPDQPIEAKVDSVGWGIAPVDGRPGYNLLPQVRANFEWIRLAKRIPVRIKLGEIPDGVKLRVGTTATVILFRENG